MFWLEFAQFIRSRKNFWLIPTFVMMALVGGLLVASKGSAVAPFIYALM